MRQPDAIARDYLLLALRLERHVSGLVDGYYGPPELRAGVEREDPRPIVELALDAVRLRARLATEVAEDDRRHWLDLQLVALETLARVRSGEPVPYLEQVARCFAYTPSRRALARFEQAAATLDDCLPGSGSLQQRLAQADVAWTVPPERVRAVVDVLVPRYRERARLLFGLPDRDELRMELVRDEPWTGYNWYEGDYRSLVQLNLDLPLRLPGLVGVVAHETYPGHHLEHALKEQTLVDEQGRLEATALLINTPECLISEGLANLGKELIVPPAELPDLLEELAPLAGVPVAGDRGLLREAAVRHAALAEARTVLDESRVNAALMLHEDGLRRETVLDYLVDVGRFAPETAAKRLQFIEHPLWRTYVFVYSEGEALLGRWLRLVPEAQRAARFGRLLREPLTPPAIEAEIATATGGARG